MGAKEWFQGLIDTWGVALERFWTNKRKVENGGVGGTYSFCNDACWKQMIDDNAAEYGHKRSLPMGESTGQTGMSPKMIGALAGAVGGFALLFLVGLCVFLGVYYGGYWSVWRGKKKEGKGEGDAEKGSVESEESFKSTRVPIEEFVEAKIEKDHRERKDSVVSIIEPQLAQPSQQAPPSLPAHSEPRPFSWQIPKW